MEGGRKEARREGGQEGGRARWWREASPHLLMFPSSGGSASPTQTCCLRQPLSVTPAAPGDPVWPATSQYYYLLLLLHQKCSCNSPKVGNRDRMQNEGTEGVDASVHV